jgi:hypothetical protein
MNITESLNSQVDITNMSPIQFDHTRFFGPNRYRVVELRKIVSSHQKDIKIGNRFKTHAMLCAELEGKDSTFIDSNRLASKGKDKYTIADLRGFAKNLDIPTKEGNNYKPRLQLIEEIQRSQIKPEEGILVWSTIGNDTRKWYGITKLRDVFHELMINDRSHLNYTRKRLIDEIEKHYIKWYKEINRKEDFFDGICMNPNIHYTDWTEFRKSDVVVDEEGFCFTVNELMYYIDSGRQDHPWTTMDLRKTRVKNSTYTLFDYVKSLKHDPNELRLKMIYEREFQKISPDLLDHYAGTKYLVNRLDSYIKSANFYMEPMWIINNVRDDAKGWWNKFKCLSLLTMSIAKPPNLFRQIIKDTDHLLEVLNQVIDCMFPEYSFRLKLVLFMIFRPDKNYSIAQLNHFIIHGFPENAFLFL